MTGGRRWPRWRARRPWRASRASPSGCAVLSGFGLVSQPQVIGDLEAPINICASGTTNCSNGASGLMAIDGSGQRLVGLQARNDVELPATLPSVGSPPSPSSRALATPRAPAARPAAAGQRWAGYIPPTLTYSTTSSPRSLTLKLVYKLRQGADGSPFKGPVSSSIAVGSRLVTPDGAGVAPGHLRLRAGDGQHQDTTICNDGGGGRDRDARPRRAGRRVPHGGPGRARHVHLPPPLRGSGVPTGQLRAHCQLDPSGRPLRRDADAYLPRPTAAARRAWPSGSRPAPPAAPTRSPSPPASATARPARGRGPHRAGGAADSGGAGRRRAAGSGGRRLRLTRDPAPPPVGGAGPPAGHRRSCSAPPRAGRRAAKLFQGRAKAPKASKRVRLRVPGTGQGGPQERASCGRGAIGS